MAKNALSPVTLAKEMIEHHRAQITSTISICQCFAKGWSAYAEGEWSNVQVEQFLITLYQNGIGPDPTKTILKEDKGGKYSISSSTGSFSSMKSIGEHKMFSDKQIVGACQVSGYSVLYALVRYYNALCGKGSKPDHETAKREVLKILEKGSELSRDDITDATEKLKRTRWLTDAKPKKNKSKGDGESVSYQNLISNGAKFDTLFLTPSKDVLNDVAGSSFDILYDRYSFSEVRAETGDLHILADGSMLEAALKLAKTMGETEPYIYGVGTENTNDRFIAFSEIDVLLSSTKIKFSGKISQLGSSQELVQSAISDGSKEQLHLFAEEQYEGWTIISPEEATRLKTIVVV